MYVSQPFRDVLEPHYKVVCFVKILLVTVLYLCVSGIVFGFIENANLPGFLEFRFIDACVIAAIFTSGIFTNVKREFFIGDNKSNGAEISSWKNILEESAGYLFVVAIVQLLFISNTRYCTWVIFLMLLSVPPFLKGLSILIPKMASKIFRHYGDNLLVVGSGPQAMAFVNSLENSFPGVVENLRILDDEWIGSELYKQPTKNFIKGISQIRDVLSQELIDRVYVLLPFRSQYDKIINVVSACIEQGIPVVIRPVFDVPDTSNVVVSATKQDDSIVGMQQIFPGSPLLYSIEYRFLKRSIDILGSIILLIITSPIMLFAAFLVKISSPGPIIFKQKRLGFRKRKFHIYKFRTMYVGAEKELPKLLDKSETGGAAFKMKRDPRVTPVGRLLRRFSIDELPQLFNVLKGDMSLVGPRPLPLTDYERFYKYSHFRRMAVRPGITGLWQVSGRSDIPFEKWMQLDQFYIDNWSLMLDFKILLKTIKAIFTGHGAV